MLGFFVAAVFTLGQATDLPAKYSLTIGPAKDAVNVEISMHIEHPYLEIDEGSYSRGVDGGLAGFVEELNVARADGTPVSISGPVGGRWRFEGVGQEPVTVRYRVRLDHEQQPWPFGADEIAYTRSDSVFFLSCTILLVNEGVRSAQVRFAVPEGWRVATPWQPVEDETNSFDVDDPGLLRTSCILVGNFVERQVTAGPTTVTLAVGTGLAPYVDPLDACLRAVVPAFADRFDDMPQARFLAVVNAHTTGGITDGSAYPNSISMLTPVRMEGINYEQAIYTIAHEVLHLWNGKRMQPAVQMEWFREGFTDYLTWRTLTALHLVKEDAILRALRRQVTSYENLDRSVSIGAAGLQKARNSVLVYEGGSLAALCLDATLRESSGNQHGVGDLMREVYARSAKQGTTYDLAMLIAVATELAGRDMADFFDRYIQGMEPLPLDECLPKLGLRAERKSSGDRVSVIITADESATGAAAAARNAFLGRE